MRRALVVLSAAAATAVAATSLALTAPAGASGPPDIVLRPVTNQIDVHDTSIAFVFKVYNLAPNSRVLVQVRDGAKWLNLSHSALLSGTTSGKISAPATGDYGVHSYRGVVVRYSKGVVADMARNVYSYGTFAMNALCDGAFDGQCSYGTRTLNDGSKFSYVFTTGVNEPAAPWTIQIGAAYTTCRWITFRFLGDKQKAGKTYLDLRQVGGAPQTYTGSSAIIGTFHATLNGQKFGLSVEQDQAESPMYFNGQASCYSTNGA